MLTPKNDTLSIKSIFNKPSDMKIYSTSMVLQIIPVNVKKQVLLLDLTIHIAHPGLGLSGPGLSEGYYVGLIVPGGGGALTL